MENSDKLYIDSAEQDEAPIINALGAGVEPGGLRSTTDIKLMVCYLLNSVRQSVAREHLADILQQDGIANYFEVIAAAGELLAQGHLSENGDGTLKIEETGVQIAETLESFLPFTQREKAVAAAIKFLAYLRIERENKVDFARAEGGGYRVTCRSLEGERELVSVSLLVADRLQAEAVRRIFLSDPAVTYSGVLALLTGDINPVFETAVKIANEEKERERDGQTDEE